MSPPLKVAIIGAGLIGPRHAQSVLSNPSTELIALVDPAESGPATAAKLQTQYFPTLSALLYSSAKPDAAIVCTPNHTHVSISKELLSAGVHVLVEKPVSESIESGLSLLRHARQPENAHLKLLVGHHRRFNPYVLKAKEIIDSRALGQIVAVNGLWATFKPPSYFSPPTEWRRSRASGGVIPINLVHDIDIMHHLFGPIIRVFAEATRKQRSNPPHDANEGAAITLRFSSGVVGTFLLSDATPSPHTFETGTGENPMIPQAATTAATGGGGVADFYRIFGSDACLSVPDMRRWSYDGREEKSWTQPLALETFDVVHATPFDVQLRHFADAIRGSVRLGCTCEEGLRALVVCDAVRRSLESGLPVDVGLELE
ncbi:hypothetical protein AJ80_02611 [Polytolypa hystricis UAMH7299]|uniref:Gfo/Idh/MocA-like oxidoreductase N-terminal domain-containing protein n=1 Tax=Polytolypa hystricis (strain UAMH7299) TaxID=1447883 RepID=A0A2B7YR61_POLH7|nr:hypothetical protein AJ80_02611 [Polytolypa hystricis UAMH7299]